MKLLINLVRWYPIIVNAFVVFTLIGCLCGCEKEFGAYNFIGQTIYMNVLVYSASLFFKFGTWHRVLLYNCTLALVLETLQFYGIYFDCYVYILIITTFVAVTFSIYEKAK